MEVCNRLDSFIPPPGGTSLAIGNFDGVHRGHARLMAQARDISARLHADPVAVTFDPHPLAVLSPERAPARLTTLAEKLALLEPLSLARCIVLHSEPELLGQRAEDFLARLVTHTRPRAFVEGTDFNFGRGRTGNIATLQQHAQRWGYEVHVVPPVHCTELPTNPVISSSSIRQALRDGRASEANAMLGRPYRVTGLVEHGESRGAKLGFPTINLGALVHLLPQYAVYAALAQLADGALHPAAVNIGPQPTFGDGTARVEAHLLDFSGNLRGQRVGLHFLSRLRDQIKFPTVAALTEQLRHDVAATRIVAAHTGQVDLIPL